MTPDDLEVAACMRTKGAWCKFTSPMYSTVHSPSCISSVFLKKSEQIKELCEVETSLQKTPYAAHWKEHVWILSILKTTSVFINCVIKEERQVIHPPQAQVAIPPGCSAFIGDYIYIPPSQHSFYGTRP